MKLLDYCKLVTKHEPNLIKTGSELGKMRINRIPSGVFVFDYLTGGGIPSGRYISIYGSKHSGKTTFSLLLAKNFLRLNPNSCVLFVDIERALDPVWVQTLVGSDLSRLSIIMPDFGEQAIDMIVKVLQEVDDIGLIVVDSIGNLISVDEPETSSAKGSVSPLPKLVNSLIRKTFPIISKIHRTEGREVTMLFLNQIRSSFGAQRFAPTHMKAGGHYQDHIYSLDIRFYLKNRIKRGNKSIKAVHQFTIEKDKCGSNTKRSGEFIMSLCDHDNFYAGQICDHEVVANYLIKSPLFKDKSVMGRQFSTRASVIQALQTDKDFYEQVKSEVLRYYLSTNAEDDGIDEEVVTE